MDVHFAWGLVVAPRRTFVLAAPILAAIVETLSMCKVLSIPAPFANADSKFLPIPAAVLEALPLYTTLSDTFATAVTDTDANSYAHAYTHADSDADSDAEAITFTNSVSFTAIFPHSLAVSNPAPLLL